MSTFNNVNVLDSILAKELFYMPGDVAYVSGKFCGYITGGRKNIYTSIPMNKIVHSSVQSATAIDNGGTTIRQDDVYVYGDGGQNVKWNGNLYVILTDEQLSITLESSTALNAVNNSTVGILFMELAIYFN